MREWFKARNTWGGAFLALSDAEAGRLAKALWTYTMTGKQPKLSGAEKATFAMFQITLDQDAERESDISSKRAIAGSAGGKQRLANQAIATFAKQNEQPEANATNKNQNQNQKKKKIFIDDDDDITRARKEETIAGFFEYAGREPTPEEVNALTTSANLLGFSPEMIREAIRIAASHGAKDITAYAKKILSDWDQYEIRTPEEAGEYQFLYDSWSGKTVYGHPDPLTAMRDGAQRRREKHAEETA